MSNGQGNHAQIESLLLRLYAAHSALYAFTTVSNIERYLEGVLKEVPNVLESEIFLFDPTEVKKRTIHSKFAGEFSVSQGSFSTAEFFEFCKILDSKDISVYPIKTVDIIFGLIAAKIETTQLMPVADAVLNSFAISTTTILENAYQKNLLEINNKELILHRAHLNEIVKSQTISLNKANDELKTILDKTVESIALITEQRDPYTAGHQYRVAKLAVAIAEKLSLNSHVVHNIYMGALVHDIGKIRVPADILVSPAKLLPIEFELIKLHPAAGYKIVQNIPFDKTISDIVHQHHERLDGSGYPNNLTDKQISLPVRIVSVADVFEAMSSHRPYRAKHSVEETLSELTNGAGKRYDKKVVDCCVELISKDGFELPKTFYTI